MDVQVQNLEGLKRKLTLALPWETLNAEVEKRLAATQRKARVHGFRPGKAPLKMIEGMYGPSIRDEVLNESVQKAFYDVVSKQDIAIAGLPSFKVVEDEADKEHIKIDAEFETFPEVKVGDYSGKTIDKISCEVGEAEVEKTIDILRKQRTSYHHVERAAAEGDRVIIDFTGTIDGEPFEGNSSQHYPFILGAGQMLPEFESGVVGMKEGETKDVSVSFPADYHGKDVAGKTAVFAITLRNVSEARLPEVDEKFAKSLGVEDGNIATMREEVKKNIEREINRRTDAQTKENVMNALLEVTEFDVPQALISQEAARLRDNARENFINQGFDAKNLPEMPAELFKEEATRRVKLGLILAELVKEHNLNASDEEVRAVVTDFAESYEDPEEVVEWYMSSPQNLEGPKALAVESKVVKHVLGKAQLNEVKRSFDEVMGTAA